LFLNACLRRELAVSSPYGTGLGVVIGILAAVTHCKRFEISVEWAVAYGLPVSGWHFTVWFSAFRSTLPIGDRCALLWTIVPRVQRIK